MMGNRNHQVRFLGEGAVAMPLPYPTPQSSEVYLGDLIAGSHVDALDPALTHDDAGWTGKKPNASL